MEKDLIETSGSQAEKRCQEFFFLENTPHSLANQRIEKLEELLRRRIFGFAEIVVQGAVITVPLAIGSDGNSGLPEHLFKA